MVCGPVRNEGMRDIDFQSLEQPKNGVILKVGECEEVEDH